MMSVEKFLAATLLIVCPSFARAQAIEGLADFEDFSRPDSEFVLPTREPFDYKNLRWQGVYLVNGSHPLTARLGGTGYRTGRVSGDYIAVVAGRKYSHSDIIAPKDTVIEIHSLYLTAVWRVGLTVQLDGYRHGQVIASESLTLDPEAPKQVELGFTGIDRLRISAAGGEDSEACRFGDCQPGPEVALDDLTFVIHPEAHEALTQAGEAPEPEALGIGSEQPEPASERPDPAPKRPKTTEVKVAEVKVEAPPEPAKAKAQAAQPAKADPPAPRNSGECPQFGYWGVRVGVFGARANALGYRDRLAAQFSAVRAYVNSSGERVLYRVMVGCEPDRESAKLLRERLGEANIEGIVEQGSERSLGTLVEE